MREHFGEMLKQDYPDAWREAHSRLYEHYKSQAPELPEEMAPLFAAVAHGCHAGRHQDAYELYRGRIRRGNEYFSTYKLGAFGSDLAALSGFFDSPWREPVANLDNNSKPTVLGIAGFNLRSLGRLAEATQPMQAALEAKIDSLVKTRFEEVPAI